MTRLLIIPLLLLLALAGCNNTAPVGSAQEELFKRLKDPYSAKLVETIEFKNFACIKYNAKNSYGAYTGETWAIMEKRSLGWSIVKNNQDFCFKEQLMELAEPQRAAEKAAVVGTVLAVMRKHKLIPDDIDSLEKLHSGPCFNAMMKLQASGTLAVVGDNAEQRAEFKRQYNEGMQRLTQGKCEAVL